MTNIPGANHWSCGVDTYDKNRALDIFEDTLQLANANRYSCQYSYPIYWIGINSYSFQGSNLIRENGILVKKKMQS